MGEWSDGVLEYWELNVPITPILHYSTTPFPFSFWHCASFNEEMRYAAV